MKFSCDQCSAQYMIADEKVGDRGVKVKCKKCEHVIVVKPQAADAAPPEEEQSDSPAEGGAFNAMFGEGSFNEPTQAMSSSQLDDLKAQAAESSSESAPAGADPFGAPAEDPDPFGAPAETPDPFGAPAENPDPFGAPAADAGATDSAFGGPTDPGYQDPARSAFPGDASGADAGAGFDAPAGDGFDGSAAADASAPVGFDGSSGAGFDASAPMGFDGSSGAGFEAPAGDGGADLSALASTTPTGSDTSGESNLDAAFGTGDAASAEAAAPAPSSTEPGEKEWYVAIDDSQVGPVDVLEIEQRWDSMELDEDTLAWKAGMADWSPVAEIPELAYLVTERPQQRPEAAASAFGASAGAGGTVVPGVAAAAAGGGSLGPVAFGGDSGAEVSDVSWTPSAASALSSLVQDELTAPEPTADPGPTGPSASDMGMPSFGGAADIFGGDAAGGGNGGTAPTSQAPVSAMGPAPASDPFSGGSPAWSVPKSESKGNKGLIIGISVAAAAVVIACIVVVVVVVMPKQQQPIAAVQPPVQPPVQPGVTPPAQPGQPSQPVADATPPPVDDAALKAGGGKAGGGKAGGGKAGGGKAGGGKGGGGKGGGGKGGGGKGGGGKGGGGKGIDDIFDKPSGAGSTRVLGKADIVNGFKKNAGGLKSCIASAAKSGQLARGSHKLVLAWVIQPNGSVSNGRLTGPANVMGTSMPSCFRGKMRSWKFPPSKQSTPVTGYPLPFNL